MNSPTRKQSKGYNFRMKETHKLYRVDNFILNIKIIHTKVTDLIILFVLSNFECYSGTKVKFTEKGLGRLLIERGEGV